MAPADDGSDDRPGHGENGSVESAGGLKPVAFTAAETELLRKACRAFRNTIPIYLKSRAHEVKMIEELLRKLS